MKRAINRLTAMALMLAGMLACNAFAADATGEAWQYKTSINMSGMSMDLPPASQCQPAGQADAPPVQSNCTTSNVHSQDNTTSFDIACGPPEPMTGSGTATRTADTITGSYTLTSADGPVSFSVSGTKVGACTPQ